MQLPTLRVLRRLPPGAAPPRLGSPVYLSLGSPCGKNSRQPANIVSGLGCDVFGAFKACSSQAVDVQHRNWGDIPKCYSHLLAIRCCSLCDIRTLIEKNKEWFQTSPHREAGASSFTFEPLVAILWARLGYKIVALASQQQSFGRILIHSKIPRPSN